MHEESKVAFKEAILRSLPILRELVTQFSEPYLVWSKQGERQWHGRYEEKPNVREVFAKAQTSLVEAAATFARIFFERYPQYGGMVGFHRFGHFDLGHDKSYILRHALSSLWDRQGTFELSESCVDAVVEEFVEFIDKPTVRFRFQAQLLNYEMTPTSLTLPDNLTVRRLSEQEVSMLYGGPLEILGFRPRPSFGIQEFVIEGEEEEVKVFGGVSDNNVSTSDQRKARLDRAILCFRTFKAGRIGYDRIHSKPLGFCPFPGGSHGYGDLYVPAGSYHLSDDEASRFCEYASLVFEMSEAAMETACGRLADAETRIRPQDQIVDAVIGMEALLLAGLAKEDRRGELRYRFSLHFASLFNAAEERYRAFHLARDLYDLRSRIAHGDGNYAGTFRVGEEKLGLSEAAKRAKDTLRRVIRLLLPQAAAAQYKRAIFWERAYFGLGEAQE